MKTKFQLNDRVKTETAIGHITGWQPFPDHHEYLVEFPDGTATWLHEEKLSSVGRASTRAEAGSSVASPPQPISQPPTPNS